MEDKVRGGGQGTAAVDSDARLSPPFLLQYRIPREQKRPLIAACVRSNHRRRCVTSVSRGTQSHPGLLLSRAPEFAGSEVEYELLGPRVSSARIRRGNIHESRNRVERHRRPVTRSGWTG